MVFSHYQYCPFAIDVKGGEFFIIAINAKRGDCWDIHQKMVFSGCFPVLSLKCFNVVIDGNLTIHRTVHDEKTEMNLQR